MKKPHLFHRLRQYFFPELSMMVEGVAAMLDAFPHTFGTFTIVDPVSGQLHVIIDRGLDPRCFGFHAVTESLASISVRLSIDNIWLDTAHEDKIELNRREKVHLMNAVRRWVKV